MLLTLIVSFLVVEILNNIRIWEIQKQLHKKEITKLTREEKKKMEQMKSSFDNLMKYDEEIAMKRK